MELRMKNFNIWAFTGKSDFERGGIYKKPIKRRDCLKRGAWTVWRFRRGVAGRGLVKEEGMVLFKGGGLDTPMHTMFLDQTEGERKAFLGASKEGSRIVRLPPRALGCHKSRKNLSFCEIWNNPTPPLFFITPPYR